MSPLPRMIKYNKSEFDNMVKLVKQHNPHAEHWTDDYIISTLNDLVKSFIGKPEMRFTCTMGALVFIDDTYSEPVDGVLHDIVFLSFALTAWTGIKYEDDFVSIPA